MGIEIQPYTEDMITAVIHFNSRLKTGGVHYKFSELNISKWLPKIDDRKIYQEYFLCLENGSTARGAYILKHQEFSFNGNIVSIADYQLPISEGIVNKTYFFIGSQMVRNALVKQPLLFALGMGGYEEALPMMLKAIGWSMFSVPFFFKINHPQHFLKNITYLKKSRHKKFLLDFISATGLGFIAIKTLNTFHSNKAKCSNDFSYEIVSNFSHWVDELWEECKDKYSMIAVRNSDILNILYPSDSDRFVKIKVTTNSSVIGLAVVLDTKMSNHKQFGNMRVGSIIDCLALPENASKVIASASQYLDSVGVDLLISNQSHAAWCSALKRSGFIKGPSNFIFAASKKLAGYLQPFALNKTNIHLNRGDGDGPINL